MNLKGATTVGETCEVSRIRGVAVGGLVDLPGSRRTAGAALKENGSRPASLMAEFGAAGRLGLT
jgi:hypothetical protein